MEANLEIISALVKTIKKMKAENLDVHKKLLIESQNTNQIYVQILSSIRHQNAILDELKRTDRIRLSHATI